MGRVAHTIQTAGRYLILSVFEERGELDTDLKWLDIFTYGSSTREVTPRRKIPDYNKF